MNERYPGYDVLAKRHTPSWNEQTRRVVDARLAVPRDPRYLTQDAFVTLDAISARIVPQPAGRPPVPVAALVDDKLVRNRQDGYRAVGMPREREAWRIALDAMRAEALTAHGRPFHELDGDTQDALLRRMEAGELIAPEWQGMSSKTFFQQRLLPDVVHAYWSHPTAWSEIGWGGPASPRGYVRLGYDRRDPWEAVEAIGDGDRAEARRKNLDVG